MPLCTYACDDHGEFSAWGKMAESEAPQPCPACTEPAPRALARPALGGRSDGGALGMGACGAGACAPHAPGVSGGCCGGGACVH